MRGVAVGSALRSGFAFFAGARGGAREDASQAPWDPWNYPHGGCGVTRRADERIRTADPFITSEVLYQLSYVGEAAR